MDEKKNRKGIEVIRRLWEENRTVVLVGLVTAVVVAVSLTVGMMIGRHMQPASSGSVSDGMTEESQDTAAEESTVGTPVVPLEENSHPEVNAVIEAYYQAAAQGDTEQLGALARGIGKEMLIYLQKRSAYIDTYQNLVCYTKAGLEEGSYVVYASYDVKFYDMETPVPGVSPHLVQQDQDGTYYIYEGEVAPEVDSYLKEISAQDDVVDLCNRVQVRYDEAVAEDEALSQFLDQMTEDLKVEVGEALAEAEKESQSAEAQADPGTVIHADRVRAIDVVNVRASDSEQAERIGRVQVGEELDLIESRANGWSMVEYEGREAFIKSEFLEPVEQETQEQQGDPGAEQISGGDLPASGTVTVDDTINIRKSASATSERIAVCYEGSQLEILSHQDNGWTRVRYEGETGYVRTDVLVIRKE